MDGAGLLLLMFLFGLGIICGVYGYSKSIKRNTKIIETQRHNL